MEKGAIVSNNTDVHKIFNDGERMVPFLSHDSKELVRHYSSHNFFKKIIAEDIKKLGLENVSVLDLGFGTGYASYLYSKVDGVSSVHGIDVSAEGLEWAQENFYSKNIKLELSDAKQYLSRSKPHDYIVTRHVLEHIDDGLNIIEERKFNNRLCMPISLQKYLLIVSFISLARPKCRVRNRTSSSH